MDIADWEEVAWYLDGCAASCVGCDLVLMLPFRWPFGWISRAIGAIVGDRV